MTTETTSASAPRSIPITPADESAVRATIDDYYLGWYDAAGDRMARALHPELAKRGWRLDGTSDGVFDRDTRDTMVRGAASGQGRRPDPADRRFDVEVNDVYGDIAAAVVHGVPYVDYVHLVRTPDGWRILNALWCPV
jgi:pantothenate kinase-related protein Tda10